VARPLYRDHGVVLRTWKLGEADRIVSVMTRQHGKVRAVVKGVRKTKSRFGARVEPTTHGSVQFYLGRDLDILTQIEVVDAFAAIRGDLTRLGRAAVMLEAIDQVAPEREPTPELYHLLLGALRTLDQGDRPLLLSGFLLKLLVAEGVQPALDCCVGCGAADGLGWFDPVAGGTRCRACAAGIALPPGSIGLMAEIIEGRLRLVLDEVESPATRAIEAAATASLERHLERRLRAPTVAADSSFAPLRAQRA